MSLHIELKVVIEFYMNPEVYTKVCPEAIFSLSKYNIKLSILVPKYYSSMVM